MAKKSKKRTKRYSGEDAKQTNAVSSEQVVHKFEAVNRSPVGEWWQSHKRAVKLGAGGLGIASVSTWLIVELGRIVF